MGACGPTSGPQGLDRDGGICEGQDLEPIAENALADGAVIALAPARPVNCKSCEGTGSELRLRRLGNGSMQIVYQCLTCGRSASNPLSKTVVPGYLDLPKWDESLAREHDEARQQDRDEKRSQWFEEHDAYLRTPAWRNKRALVLKRCNGICEGCAGSQATQVHHLTYDHWQCELLWELVAVCDDCHEKAHIRQPNYATEGKAARDA